MQDPYVINPPSSPSNLRRRRPLRQRQSSRYSSTVFLPRLVDRKFPYHQSQNRIAVRNINHRSHIYKLLLKDWFHVLLRIPANASLTGLLILWTIAILFFAVVYVYIDEAYLDLNCGLGDPGSPIQFGTAFAFSLETCTTVGCKLQWNE